MALMTMFHNLLGSDKMAGLGDSGKMAGVEQHLSLV